MRLFWSVDGFLTVRILSRWRIRFHWATAVLSFMAGVLIAGPSLIFGAIILGNIFK